MKPITEIQIRICTLAAAILLCIFRYAYPNGGGWSGILAVLLLCANGYIIGTFLTNLLRAFKKWWKE